MSLELSGDCASIGPQTYVLACGRLRAQKQTKASNITKSLLKQSEPLDREISRGNVEGPMLELLQQVVQNVHKSVFAVINDERNFHWIGLCS